MKKVLMAWMLVAFASFNNMSVASDDLAENSAHAYVESARAVVETAEDNFKLAEAALDAAEKWKDAADRRLQVAQMTFYFFICMSVIAFGILVSTSYGIWYDAYKRK